LTVKSTSPRWSSGACLDYAFSEFHSGQMNNRLCARI